MVTETNCTFTFKPLEEKDLPRFFMWIKMPHVTRWWSSDTYDIFVKKHRPRKLAESHVFPFIMYLNEKPIGYIQYYLADKTDDGWWMTTQGQPPGTVGVDIIIGEMDYIGKGFGTLFVKKFVEKIFKETSAPKIIIDPDKENVAAIRCYEKVGFRKVREVISPPFFDSPSGTLLLMELDRTQVQMPECACHNQARVSTL